MGSGPGLHGREPEPLLGPGGMHSFGGISFGPFVPLTQDNLWDNKKENSFMNVTFDRHAFT